MQPKTQWWHLYLYTALAIVVVFAIKPGDTGGYVLWLLGTYGMIWFWIQNNPSAMLESHPSRQPLKKKVVQIRYEPHSGD